MAMTRSGQRNVIGVYPDVAAARKAITGLEAAGFDGDDIRLLGAGSDDAASRVDVSGRDARVATRVGTSSVAGMFLGAILGGLLGLVVALLVAGNLAWVFVVGGAVAGFNFGMAVGGYLRLRATDDWDLAFDPHAEGEAAVAVRSTDGAGLDRAADALRAAGATRVELV